MFLDAALNNSQKYDDANWMFESKATPRHRFQRNQPIVSAVFNSQLKKKFRSAFFNIYVR